GRCHPRLAPLDGSQLTTKVDARGAAAYRLGLVSADERKPRWSTSYCCRVPISHFSDGVSRRYMARQRQPNSTLYCGAMLATTPTNWKSSTPTSRAKRLIASTRLSTKASMAWS